MKKLLKKAALLGGALLLTAGQASCDVDAQQGASGSGGAASSSRANSNFTPNASASAICNWVLHMNPNGSQHCPRK